MNRTLFRHAAGLLLCLLLSHASYAQVCDIPANQITVSPAVYTAETMVTVTIDATGTCLAGVTSMQMWLFVPGCCTAPGYNDFCAGPPEPTATSLGMNRWSFSFTMTTVMGLPASQIPSFGVIFKSASPNGPCNTRPGGGNLQTQDIILTPQPPGLAAIFTAPTERTQLLNNGASVMLTGQSNQATRLRIFKGLEQVTPLAEVASGTSVSFNFTGTADESGFIRLRADAGMTTVEDTFFFAYRPGSNSQGAVPTPANPPAGVKDGINYMSATSVIVQLRAPLKNYVYIIGDHSRWGYSNSYFLRRRADDNDRFWVEITGLTPGHRYRYQYEVDGQIRVPDPYAELILDQFNDGGIPTSVYPNRQPYPNLLTTGTVGVFQTNKPAFNWTDAAWQSRANQLDPRRLTFYELWTHNWSSPYTNTTKSVGATEGFQRIIDSLGYFQRLGINALKIMPVSEFSNNLSWGYNPQHQSAVDKAYGPPEKLKELVNAAHARGIAVVLDVVFNHTDGDNPIARLWWDGANNRPAANSPYLNPIARHPFNVFYDMNHESMLTRDYTVQTLRYWMDEYHVDGFRFDLSKGFTQVNSGSNVGLWNQRDQSRIDIWTYYRNQLRATHPNCWLILEHLANDDEEAELAGLGFWMWGNVKGQAAESAIGGTLQSTDLRRAYHESRGFTQHHLVAYAVSHDENRLGREIQNNGVINASTNTFYGTSYNPRSNRAIRYDRQKAALAFTWLIPGPKMLWMWDEFGYEIDINWCDFQGNINNDCRTNPKPPGWGMINSPGVSTGCVNLYVTGCNNPVMLFDTNAVKMQRFSAEILNLRKDFPVFASNDIGGSQLDGLLKRLKITPSFADANNYNVILIGNFGTGTQSIDPAFHTTGRWYEFFNGDSINVTNVNQLISLQAGEIRLYTSRKIRAPRHPRLTPYWRVNNFTTSNEVTAGFDPDAPGTAAYPNPWSGALTVQVWGRYRGQVAVRLYDLSGREVATRLIDKRDDRLETQLDASALGAGMYYLHVSQGSHADVLNVVKQ